ncbi:MAG TPA: DUF4019 domain-containing protein [Terriglobales bacterium]|nr:DUF4019 domain-containing protein [Terriglobales bacterium]
MKRLTVVMLLAILIAPLLMAQDKNTEPAQKAGDRWIAVIDKGDYAGSYERASSMFKGAIGKDDWVQKSKGVRDPLGNVVSRKLDNAQYSTTLPGAPDGEYVVLKYDTSFANKKSAVETVVMMLDKDEQWRVSGYFIR